MSSLSMKTKKINLIISLKNYNDDGLAHVADALDKWLGENADLYAFIKHDKDITPEGERKHLHLHCVALLKSPVRLSTCMNGVAKACGLLNDAISIEKYTSFEGCVQYLTHKNDLNKAQYDWHDIRKNFSDDDLSNYMDAATSGLDLDKWIACINVAEDMVDVIRGIGVQYYNMYSHTVDTLFKTIHGRPLFADNIELATLKELIVHWCGGLDAMCSDPINVNRGYIPIKDVYEYVHAMAYKEKVKAFKVKR